MSFVSAMDATMQPKRVLGENSSPEVSAEGVGDARVALFGALCRGTEASRVRELARGVAAMGTAAAWADLAVLSFQTRDCRGPGKGEKALFYVLFEEVERAAPETARGPLLRLVPEYGYYKDLFAMWASSGERTRAAIIELAAAQLRADEAAEKPSLLAKYAPREKRRYAAAAKALARALYGEAGDARKRYRQLVAALTAKLDVAEVKMCSKRWREIRMDAVPSLCLARSRKAFLNEKLKRTRPLATAEVETGDRFPDDEDRVACRAALRAAALSRKLKGKQLFPHEVVHAAMRLDHTASVLEADVLEAQWRRIVDDVRAGAAAENAVATDGEKRGVDLGKLVALVDVSGSMTGTPMEVAIALGLLVAELAAPQFANRVLTFESQPRWHSVDASARVDEKVRRLAAAPWGGSTNFERAIECILQACVDHKVAPDEVPDLIVFSDMQFDAASAGPAWETQHERLVRRFAETGTRVSGAPWLPPTITYWNLRGDTKGGFMAEADKPGVRLLAGFSPALLRFVLQGDDLEDIVQVLPDGSTTVLKASPTPYETMRKAIDHAAYDPVRKVLAASTETVFADYTFDDTDADWVDAATV